MGLKNLLSSEYTVEMSNTSQFAAGYLTVYE